MQTLGKLLGPARTIGNYFGGRSRVGPAGDKAANGGIGGIGEDLHTQKPGSVVNQPGAVAERLPLSVSPACALNRETIRITTRPDGSCRRARHGPSGQGRRG